jgi:hypothetical protein
MRGSKQIAIEELDTLHESASKRRMTYQGKIKIAKFLPPFCKKLEWFYRW